MRSGIACADDRESSDRRVWNTIDKERAVNVDMERETGLGQNGDRSRIPCPLVAGRRKEKTEALRMGGIFLLTYFFIDGGIHEFGETGLRTR